MQLCRKKIKQWNKFPPDRAENSAHQWRKDTVLQLMLGNLAHYMMKINTIYQSNIMHKGLKPKYEIENMKLIHIRKKYVNLSRWGNKTKTQNSNY